MKNEYTDYYRMLGLNIAYYRKLVDFTQDELAERLDINQPHLSRIENATVGISMDMLFKIADTLGIPPYKLLDFRD